MSTNDSFDRQFRRQANGMRRRPSARTWNRIEDRLDGRGRGFRILGLRPWIIAAVVLLVAGFAAFSQLPALQSPSALAQHAESVEELGTYDASRQRIPDYQPVAEGRADGQVLSRSESRSRITVAPKYRL